MRSRQTGMILTVAAIFLGMAWAWSIARDAAWEDMIAVNNQIRELTYADSVLDREVLRVRSAVVDHYDDVTSASAVLRAAGLRLADKLASLGILDAELGPLSEQLQVKLDFVENLKAQNSILRNSESYLPVLLDEYARSYHADQSELQSLFLRSLVLTDRAASERLKNRLEILAPISQELNLSEVRSRVAMHGLKSLETRQSIQPMLHAFLSIPMHEAITRLTQAFNREQAQREQTRERYRSLLYISAFGFFLLSLVFVLRFVRLNRKTQSFVPYELLNLLGKRTILDIEYGTSIQREMTVMFVDLRDFSRTCEGRKPAENFALVNEYLAAITPAIQSHQGFVSQYTGDGVMALFPGSADDAVTAAIELLQALERLNQERQQRGEARLRLGVGLNTSEIMLGTIGHQKRMECTVLGNGVNVAARIEGLTRVYGCDVLLSEFTARRLQGQPSIRKIDHVRPKGLQETVGLYELILGEPLKAEQQAVFQEARDLYAKRDFRTAASLFSRLAGNDAVSALYVQRCRKLETEPPPAEWDGVADFSSK